jgi:hypothetical protein
MISFCLLTAAHGRCRDTTYSMVNGLAMDGHLVFRRDRTDATADAAGNGASNGSAAPVSAPRCVGPAEKGKLA